MSGSNKSCCVDQCSKTSQITELLFMPLVGFSPPVFICSSCVARITISLNELADLQAKSVADQSSTKPFPSPDGLLGLGMRGNV